MQTVNRLYLAFISYLFNRAERAMGATLFVWASAWASIRSKSIRPGQVQVNQMGDCGPQLCVEDIDSQHYKVIQDLKPVNLHLIAQPAPI